MRISTSTLYDVNVTALNQQQAKMIQTQQQVSAGRRIMTPADDPAGAALSLHVAQADAINSQYGSNIERAQSSLSLSEGILQTVTSVLQDIRTTTVSAGNAIILSNSDRKAIASDLQGRLDELVALANTTDATGNYLFSGFQGKVQPFVNTPAGVQYTGDDGQRMIQVSSAGQVAISGSGADIFMRIKNGNGTFVTQAAPANTGSGVSSIGSVTNPTLLTGHNYQIDFTVLAGATTYSVTDTSTLPVPTVLSAGNPYVSGQDISFDGMQFDIQGIPANGDQFTVAPSTGESVFKTISDFINALNAPIYTGNVASSTQYSASVGRALNGLDRGIDNVLSTQASMGSRLRWLDSEKSTMEDLGIQYKQVLSQLQDLDYNKAISDLSQQKIMLEASQKSFKLVSGMSMFDYM